MCFISLELKNINDGISLEELVQHYTLKGVNKLILHKFIIIDHHNRVFLSERGQIARQIGFKKFLELEILEKKALQRNYKLRYWKYNILIFLLIQLIFLLAHITIETL